MALPTQMQIKSLSAQSDLRTLLPSIGCPVHSSKSRSLHGRVRAKHALSPGQEEKLLVRAAGGEAAAEAAAPEADGAGAEARIRQELSASEEDPTEFHLVSPGGCVSFCLVGQVLAEVRVPT